MIRSILTKLGILPPFTDDDVIDASMEDKLREHQKAVEAVTSATEQRVFSNQRLRGLLMDARLRSNAFADFENSIRHEERPRG